MIPYKEATFYVQVEPDFFRGTDTSGNPRLRSIRAVNITQKRPDKPRSGTVVVKLTIRIPDAAFMPLRPEAVIIIPEEMTAPYPIEVVTGPVNPYIQDADTAGAHEPEEL